MSLLAIRWRARLRPVALLATLAGLHAPRSAGAAPPDPWTSHASLAVDLRYELGSADVTGLDLGVLGVGVDAIVAPTLAGRASGVALAPLTRADDGRAATAGAGAELGLRFTPFPGLVVRPWLDVALGLLFFPRPRFLPGADVYDFMIGYGAGLEVDLTRRVVLSLRGHYVHLSNGQGLGAFNPAYDGLGATLGLRVALAEPRPVASRWEDEPRAAGRGRVGPWPGVVVDAVVGAAHGPLYASGRVRLAERVVDHLVALLDVEAGSLASDAFGEVGLGLALHVAAVTLGAHGGYRSYAGIEVGLATAQVDLHLTDEVGLVAMGGLERSTFDGTTWRAALGLRAFPVPSLALELGVGFDRLGDRAADDHSDPYAGLEWQLPLGGELGVSLWLGTELSGLQLAGVRLAWGMGSSPRARVRETGWLRLR